MLVNFAHFRAQIMLKIKKKNGEEEEEDFVYIDDLTLFSKSAIVES